MYLKFEGNRIVEEMSQDYNIICENDREIPRK
jgi:hypothetical protein